MNSFEQYRNRRHALLRISILFVTLAIALAWWSYAHAADLQIQILVGGKPASNVAYTLDWGGVSVPARALLHGYTDNAGMIHATGIATGTWMLYTGCLVHPVEVGEVTGQALMQMDGSCAIYFPVRRDE